MSFLSDMLDINGEHLTPEQAKARDAMLQELTVFIEANPRCCRSIPDWKQQLHKLRYGALCNRYKNVTNKEPPTG